VNPIGIMQGRLSPPSRGRIQSFPADTWREEFAAAGRAGLVCIEWIYEVETEAANPLAHDEGLREMLRHAKESGVGVHSICADYYMVDRLVDDDGLDRGRAVDHLRWLISRASLLESWYVVLPFVDASSLRTDQQRQGVRKVLERALPVAEDAGVELHLETDLAPASLAQLLLEFDTASLRANLDTGNSASLGHNPDDELRYLASWLGSVHIKDRVRGGGTVPLGTGDAMLPRYFQLFQEAGYRRPYILQAARTTEVEEETWAVHNRDLVVRWQEDAARNAAN
jgi:L-ribulose-5-phosphate 3-epimerase